MGMIDTWWRSSKAVVSAWSRHLAIGVALSCVFAAILLYLAKYTKYLTGIEKWRQNGVGPFEVLLYVLLFFLILGWYKSLWRLLIHYVSSPVFTKLDYLVTAVCGWHVLVIIYRTIAEPSNFVIAWDNLVNVQNFLRVFSILGILWLIARVVVAVREHHLAILSSEPSTINLLTDEAIGKDRADIDLLKRDNIVNMLYRIIKHGKTKGSLAIALTGEWGTGKTSIVNLALQKLQQESQETPIIIEFDPWYFSNEGGDNFQTLLTVFLNGLRTHISPAVVTTDLDKLFRQYYQALVPVLPDYAQKIGALFSRQTPTLDSLKQEIEDAIKTVDKKIIVVIDDLDRMERREILFILKLIRLCGDFKGIAYIVPFDWQFVEQQLQNDFPSGASSYLEKIFPIVLAVPKTEGTTLASVLQEHFMHLSVQADDYITDPKKFISELQSLHAPILTLLDNTRRIKRFLNGYFSLFPLLKHEVNPFDLFLIEIIRLRLPHIYELIYHFPQYFTFETKINWLWPSDDENTKQTRQFYEFLIGSIPEPLRNAAMELLSSLFKSVYGYYKRSNVLAYGHEHAKQYFKWKNIQHPYYFPRYFYLGVQSGVYSDEQWDGFVTALNNAQDQEEMNTLIAQRIELSIANELFYHWLDGMYVYVDKVESQVIHLLVPALVNCVERIPKSSGGGFDGNLISFVGLVGHLLLRASGDEQQAILDYVVRQENNPLAVGEIIELLADLDSKDDNAPDPNRQPRKIDFEQLRMVLRERIHNILVQEDNILERYQAREKMSTIELLSQYASQDVLRPHMENIVASSSENALRFLEFFVDRQWWGTSAQLGGPFTR
ncbi:MAG TPA: P-loop NTPase fold protein, partial [Cyclobacteriaceae bacterium]|nr:P-loop NTPase fold protein [Cyclobacteriaceae bacterium]